ncbi:MAG: putative S-layer protein, partial [Candidatus Pacearchaeota archaeon]
VLTANPTETEQISTSSVSISASSGQTIYLRWFAYNAGGSAGTFRVKNLVIDGTITTVSALTESALCAFDSGVTTNPGYLSVEVRDVAVVNGLGEDENWLPFDEIEVEVRVENKGLNNYDIDDISLEWGIVSDDLNSDWLVEFDEVDEINLKDDDKSTLTFTFRIDEDDLDMDIDEFVGSDWNLVVRATGEIDDEDNLLSTDETCAADFQEVSIDEDNAVLLDNIQVPETLQCGQTYTITADAWNIGDDEEEFVRIDVYDRNKKFINTLVELGDIDDFDNVDVSFNLNIPQDTEEGTYILIMSVIDEDSDVYEVGSDDAETTYTMPLNVVCGSASASATVTAALVSEAKAGQDLVVRATVTNTGTTSATYNLSAGGYSSWASAYTVNPTTLTLAAGQTGEATYTLKVNSGVSGEQAFNIDLVSGNQVTTQPVSVIIAAGGFLSGLSGITGSAIGSNGWVWGLGALNLILIIVIILVAMRVMRK